MNEQIRIFLQQGMEKHNQRLYQEAELNYRKVLDIDPEQPDAIHFIGVLAYNVGNFTAAKKYLRQAIQLSPDHAGCYCNMGNVYQQEGDFKTSIQYYEKTLKHDASHHLAMNNLGVAHIRLGDYDRAVRYIKQALTLSPDYAGAHNNLGESYSNLGEYEKAMNCYEKAIALEPEMVDAHWNRSLALLLRGDLDKGFAEYEWRWKRSDTPKRDIDSQKRWAGEDIRDRVVFVYEEQGLGDALQFARYLPMLREKGAMIVFEVSPVLARLFEPLDMIDKLWVRNTRKGTRQIDRYDVHCPVLSLPAMFNTRLDSIPQKIPYLEADQALTASWQRRLASIGGVKIGIAWAGNPDHRNDHNRSCMLSEFQQLADLPGVSLIGLQKDKYEKWTDIDPGSVLAFDAGDDLHDFADTAAAIENLDLVICVDTALVHLAGGMGKEVWVLVPFFPDWRWMLDRSDSPWYPTMRLFRQEKINAWSPVFRKMMKRLKK